MTFEDKTHQALKKELLTLREAGKAIIKSEMERTQEIIRLRDVQYDLVKSATTFNEIMEPFTSLPPFEAMARFKELCASGDIDMLFFELARAAKASKAALAKATHE